MDVMASISESTRAAPERDCKMKNGITRFLFVNDLSESSLAVIGITNYRNVWISIEQRIIAFVV